MHVKHLIITITLVFSLLVASFSQAQQVVSIPDRNLAAAIRQEIGNTITTDTLLRLTRLEVPNRGIRDLTGLEHAHELRHLNLGMNERCVNNNTISDLSPISGLTLLTNLDLSRSNISDISALSALKKLTYLNLFENNISDVSPLTELTELSDLYLTFNLISDISPLAELTNLTRLSLWGNTITDVSPLVKLTQLTWLPFGDNTISDISPLAELTQLTTLTLGYNTITDVSPLAELTQLTDLFLGGNTITDVSALAKLTNLTRLDLNNNTITDVSALAKLTNLTRLDLNNNIITDVSALAELTNLTTLFLQDNQISDVSALVQLNLTGTQWDSTGLDIQGNPLSYASINTHIPAMQAKGVEVKFDHRTPTTLEKVSTPITEDASNAAAPVTVSLSPSPVQSPAPGEPLVLSLNITEGENVAGYQAALQFDTTALRYVSSANGSYLPAGAFVVPTLVSGNQVTLAATSLTGGSHGDGTLATLTFEVIVAKPSVLTLSGVELTDTDADFLSVRSENGEVVTSGTPTEAVMSLTPSPVASPASGETITFNVSLMNGKNVAGYAFKLTFDATALRYISGGNAGYLPAGAIAVPPLVDENQITYIASSPNGVSHGDGTLATVTFEVIAAKPSTLRFSAVSLTDGDAKTLEVQTKNGEIIESAQIPGDVNSDGVVNLEDMAAAAARVGQTGENTADMNGDGVVDGADLLLIAAAIEQANAAPSLHPASVTEMFTATEVQGWFRLAQQQGLSDPIYQRGFLFLEQLLAILTPKETAVLPNYPNPFNPETWIPYHLSKPASVTVSIYAADGRLVRRLVLGHQSAGIYESRSRAAYWDGRNDVGEKVASGIYFYTLSTESTRDSVTAGDFAATRKMLIRK